LNILRVELSWGGVLNSLVFKKSCDEVVAFEVFRGGILIIILSHLPIKQKRALNFG
jgi:hypothetical protein